jgi:hypothetical protein
MAGTVPSSRHVQVGVSCVWEVLSYIMDWDAGCPDWGRGLPTFSRQIPNSKLYPLPFMLLPCSWKMLDYILGPKIWMSWLSFWKFLITKHSENKPWHFLHPFQLTHPNNFIFCHCVASNVKAQGSLTMLRRCMNEVVLQLHDFLTLTLDGGKRSVSWHDYCLP